MERTEGNTSHTAENKGHMLDLSHRAGHGTEVECENRTLWWPIHPPFTPQLDKRPKRNDGDEGRGLGNCLAGKVDKYLKETFL